MKSWNACFVVVYLVKRNHRILKGINMDPFNVWSLMNCNISLRVPVITYFS